MATHRSDTAPLPSFCPNCGQRLEAEAVAARAANPAAVFCPACGKRLKADGTCGNRECENFGTPISMR